MAHRIPGSNLHHLRAGLDVEGEQNRFGGSLRGIIWFTIASAGSCAVIALLAGYVRRTKSLEKVTRRVEAEMSRGCLGRRQKHHKIRNHKIEPQHLKYFQCYCSIARLDNCVNARFVIT